MLHYNDFLSHAHQDFFEKSALPTQEAHLFSLHWQSTAFWEALGARLSSECRDASASPSERSHFSISRDRHIQGLLDYLPHAEPRHHPLILDQSLRTFKAYKLLDDVSDPFSFPLPRLLSDLGAGGVSTMLDWAIELRKHGLAVNVDEGFPASSRALWLASELACDPHQPITEESVDVAEHAAWLLIHYSMACIYRGRDHAGATHALLAIARHPEIKQFPGWPMIHILGNLTSFEGLVNCEPDSRCHPFGKPELNIGALVWELPSPDLMTDAVWNALLASEQRDKTHFAKQASKKNQGTVGRRIEMAIKRFIAEDSGAFFGVDLDAKGFKNLESLGMKREVLIKHPMASAVYAEVLIGRDLGL